MKLGVVFPQTEIGNDPTVIRDFAQAAESLGYSHLIVYDHVLGAHRDRIGPQAPYDKDTPFHEPFVLFGYLAALTERIELVTSVIILPQRQTALVAKQTAEIDILSRGRLRLGIGVGWNAVEYEALGQDFHTRGRRQAEQVELIRALWENETVDFEGTYDRVSRAGILPRPERRIPIWFGGVSDAVTRRAARLGDGVFPLFNPSSPDASAYIERLHAALREVGRDIESFGVEGGVNVDVGPERWQKHLDGWRELGATHASLRTMNAGFTSPQEHIDAIRAYRENVDPD